MYRELDYGTIYYVAGTQTPEINKYVKHNARRITKILNKDEDNWLTCNIIYLEDNTLFKQRENAAFYSAMLPTVNNVDQGYSFLVATIYDCMPEQMELAFSRYVRTLLHMIDEVLDKGRFRKFHILIADDLWPDIVCIKLADGAVPISGLPIEEPKHVHNQLSHLEVREVKYKYKILLTDYGEEIRLYAQTKALYLLFLLHPKGIRLKEIEDYKEEYKRLYRLVTNRSDMRKIQSSAERVIDVINSKRLYQEKTKCNKSLYSIIPEDDIRRHYEIEVHRGGKHKIPLARKWIMIAESLRSKSCY